MLHVVPPPSAPVVEKNAETAEDTFYSETADVEYVVGKLQIASLSLLVLVVVAVCSGVAYIVGRANPMEVVRAASEKPAPSAMEVPAATPSNAASSIPASIPAAGSAAAPLTPPAPGAQPAPQGPDEIEAAMFHEPIPGQRYIQAGVVDRGVAVIMAEGLRSRGFQSLIASGPSSTTFRVLIGPLHTNEEYSLAQNAVNRLGMTNFTRQIDTPRPDKPAAKPAAVAASPAQSIRPGVAASSPAQATQSPAAASSPAQPAQ